MIPVGPNKNKTKNTSGISGNDMPTGGFDASLWVGSSLVSTSSAFPVWLWVGTAFWEKDFLFLQRNLKNKFWFRWMPWLRQDLKTLGWYPKESHLIRSSESIEWTVTHNKLSHGEIQKLFFVCGAENLVLSPLPTHLISNRFLPFAYNQFTFQ